MPLYKSTERGNYYHGACLQTYEQVDVDTVKNEINKNKNENAFHVRIAVLISSLTRAVKLG